MAKKPIQIELRDPFVANPDKSLGAIPWLPQPPVATESIEGALAKIASQLDLPPGDWKQLSYALALEAGHIILLNGKGGRPRRWTRLLHIALWFEVERWKLVHAFEHHSDVFRDDGFLLHWREQSGELDKPNTLASRYYSAAVAADLRKRLDSVRGTPAVALSGMASVLAYAWPAIQTERWMAAERAKVLRRRSPKT